MTQNQNTIHTNLTGNETDIGLLNLRPTTSKQTTRTASHASSLTIVNTKRNGMRITIAPEVIEKIGSPTRVQIALDEKGVAIGKEITGDDNYFQLRFTGKKPVIYSNDLVREITNFFGLDFENRTSLSYQEVTYSSIKGRHFAFITIKQKNQQDIVEDIGDKYTSGITDDVLPIREDIKVDEDDDLESFN